MTASRAASTLTRSARNWTECSVYIQISPRPRNVAESKEVLKVLQQYGDVVMYRHLKYEAPNPTLNAALAIYQSEHSARTVVDASPIRFRFEQRRDEWKARSWQNIVNEGTIEEPNVQQARYLNGNDERTNEEEFNERPRAQASYPYSDSPEIAGNALIGPEKWGSKYLVNALDGESNSLHPAEGTAPGIASSTTGSSQPARERQSNKRTNRSAQQLAETLIKETKIRPPSTGSRKKEEPSPLVREFELTVQKSIFNHQAYIERQAYYAGFNPDMRTLMAEDLKGRAPLEGHLDCSLNKSDVPLRIRLRRKETAKPQVSLMELWGKGKRDREQV